MVTTPITMPAQAQAIATASVLRAPSTSASSTLRQVMPCARGGAHERERQAGERAHQRRERRRVAEDEADEHHQDRDEQVAPLLHHVPEARQLRARHAGQLVALGLEVHREEHADVVEDAREPPPTCATCAYGTTRNSAITKAAAPITGGMIWPPVEATASTAAANGGRKPVRFISGNGDRPVDHHVGHRAAGHRAEQAARRRSPPCRARPRCGR